MVHRRTWMFASAIALSSFGTAAAVAADPRAAPSSVASQAASGGRMAVVARARVEVANRVSYDPRWVRIGYPGGDVAPSAGVCTDVVVRAYRAANIDLQRLVHEDILRAPEAYTRWVSAPDANIDHRRVGPVEVYLQRHARRLSVSDEASYLPGDVVVISFGTCPACSPQHIGVVSDRRGPRGLPLLIHNMGPVPSEDDTLDAFTRLGHYRLLP